MGFNPTKQPCPPSMCANQPMKNQNNTQARIGWMLYWAVPVVCSVKIHPITKTMEKINNTVEYVYFTYSNISHMHEQDDNDFDVDADADVDVAAKIVSDDDIVDVNPIDVSTNNNINEEVEVEGEEGGESATNEEIIESMDKDLFLREDDKICLADTIDFLNTHPNIKMGCAGYASSYKETETVSNEFWDEESQSYMTKDMIQLGYPSEALDALDMLCHESDGYWMVTTQKLAFTCVVMEIDTVYVVVNNYGECLANTSECIRMDIALLMESMFSTMDYACYTGKIKPDNFEELEEQVDNEYFEEMLDEEGIVLSEEQLKEQEQAMQNMLHEEKQAEDELARVKQEQQQQSNNENNTPTTMMNMSQEDMKCMKETATLLKKYPAIRQAQNEMMESMDNVNEGTTVLSVSFAYETIQQACIGSGTYFSYSEETAVSCSSYHLTPTITLKVKDLAFCLANSKECKEFNTLYYLQSLQESYGLTCDIKQGQVVPATTMPSPHPSNPLFNTDPLIDDNYDNDDDSTTMGTTEKLAMSSNYATTGLFLFLGLSIFLGFLTIQYRRRRQGGLERYDLAGRGVHERVSQCEMTGVGDSKNGGGGLRFDNGNIA
mmetsp:Transcript_1946/g.2212  ORF Transcript_1946/g.2212 Transcript_1946/m.2212 type:complete len:606 (-) Transcript_1946:35-1852(-)